MRCHNCGSGKTESDSASGTVYCVDCGTVLEENTIVAEVTFGETSGGKAVLQGSYAGESGRISGGGLFGRNRGREGQEQAIENGRVKISSLAHAVRLPERYRDAAQRYYNLAVVNRFTRGRRSDHVAAVCLYAVCRTEKSSHMLIDFSDILQVNVFTLGATFLKLCRILNLSLPHVDPSLYISRFAVALDFGDYTQRVAQDAVRIAQRMDRDWITSGRRPAGICGACLLIAARMNGFRRTSKEMIYVVKVAEITIQKRLHEFNQTESAQLSVRDFRTIWLEKVADPPSFQKNRKQITGDDEDDDEEEEGTSKKRKGKGKDTRASKRRSVDLTSSQNRKGKQPDHRSMEEIEEEEEEENEEGEEEEEEDDEEDDDDPNKVSDEEVNGPFDGNQKDISEADNGVPGVKPKISDEAIEENLIQQQIEESLNDEIKHVAEVNSSLTAEANIRENDPDATQIGTQIDELGSTLVEDEEELGSTFVEEEEHPDIIPIKNNPRYDSLSVEEKLALSAYAKAKVAQEEKELLNPDLQNDALEIASEMESWMGDDSILKAALEIEKQKYANGKNKENGSTKATKKNEKGDKEKEGEENDKAEDDDEEEEEEEEDESLSDVDDEEIDAMILTEDEVLLKTKIWYNANKEYLEEMAVRRTLEKDKGNPYNRKKAQKKKKLPPPSTPAEAAKQLLVNKKLSKKINQAVFDDMFESAESIAKIKQRDAISRMSGQTPVLDIPEYEVVEESGDIPDPKAPKKKTTDNDGEQTEDAEAQPAAEEDDDEDMDSDDMADDERLLRDARAKYAFDDGDDAPEYYSDDDY